MDRFVFADTPQIQLWDTRTVKFPEWTAGEDAVSRTSEAIAVAIADSAEGTARVVVTSSAPIGMTELGSYTFSVPSRSVNIGSFLANDFETFTTDDTEVRVTIWVEVGKGGTDPTTVVVQSDGLRQISPEPTE